MVRFIWNTAVFLSALSSSRLARNQSQSWGFFLGMFLVGTMFETTSQGVQTISQQLLPADPRHWTRDHVTLWLLHAGTQYQLGDTHPERFPMNGKSLLLMSRDMFLSRVPEGGGVLFEDVQLKLQKVITELYERVDLA